MTNTTNTEMNGLRNLIEQEVNAVAVGADCTAMPESLGILIPSLDLQKTIDRIMKVVQAQQLKLLDEVVGALPEKRTIGDYNDGGDYNYRNRRDAVDSAYNEPINRVQAKLAAIKERIEHG